MQKTKQFKYCLNFYQYGACSCRSKITLVHVSKRNINILRSYKPIITPDILKKWIDQRNDQRVEEKKLAELQAKKQMEEYRLSVERKQTEEFHLKEERLKLEEEQRKKEKEELLEMIDEVIKAHDYKNVGVNSVYYLSHICIHKDKNIKPWRYPKEFCKLRFANGSKTGKSRQHWVCMKCFPEVAAQCHSSLTGFETGTLFSKKYIENISENIHRGKQRILDKYGNPVKCHKDCPQSFMCYLEWETIETDLHAKRIKERECVEIIYWYMGYRFDCD